MTASVIFAFDIGAIVFVKNQKTNWKMSLMMLFEKNYLLQI